MELYAKLHRGKPDPLPASLLLSQGITMLAARFGRDSFYYRLRMSAISGVLQEMGLPWLAQAPPVPSQLTADIICIKGLVEKRVDLNQSLLHATADPVQLELRSAEIARRGLSTAPPAGSVVPQRVSAMSDLFLRDPHVRAWVLFTAKGVCECCYCPAPFIKQDGQPYLEVHHITRLADGGSDTVDNTVAVCPNCHRRLHYGLDAEEMKADMWARALVQRAK